MRDAIMNSHRKTGTVPHKSLLFGTMFTVLLGTVVLIFLSNGESNLAGQLIRAFPLMLLFFIGLEIYSALRIWWLSRGIAFVLYGLVIFQLVALDALFAPPPYPGEGIDAGPAILILVTISGTVLLLAGCAVAAVFCSVCSSRKRDTEPFEERSNDEVRCLSCGGVIDPKQQVCQKCGWTWK